MEVCAQDEVVCETVEDVCGGVAEDVCGADGDDGDRGIGSGEEAGRRRRRRGGFRTAPAGDGASVVDTVTVQVEDAATNTTGGFDTATVTTPSPGGGTPNPVGGLVGLLEGPDDGSPHRDSERRQCGAPNRTRCRGRCRDHRRIRLDLAHRTPTVTPAHNGAWYE